MEMDIMTESNYNVERLTIRGFSGGYFPLCDIFRRVRKLTINQVDSDNDYSIHAYNKATIDRIIEVNSKTLKDLTLNVNFGFSVNSIPEECQLEKVNIEVLIEVKNCYNVLVFLENQRSLKMIKLKDTSMDFEELCQLIERNKELEEVYLNYCRIYRKDEIKDLEKAMKDLRILDFSNSRIQCGCLKGLKDNFGSILKLENVRYLKENYVEEDEE